ncbi:TSUP family transporter, partial [Arthrospira platensis SPKY1]|nr:TSUP family transporter [Arthrospira platensis SPKY1]
LVAEPRLVVPTVMFLQIASGLQNLVQDRRHMEWPLLLWLLPGGILGTLPGLWLLLSLSPDAARLGIGLAIVATVLLLARGLRLDRLPGRPGLLAIGGLSG